MFVNVSYFYPSLIFACKAVRVGPYVGSTLVGSSLAANIRLGWKQLTVTNTLAYYGMEQITAVKSFKLLVPRANLMMISISFVS